MFYNLVLYKDLDVAPKWFGKNLRQHVEEKLIQEVEGTCNGRFGYVVAVSQIVSVSPMGFFAEAGPLQVFVSNHLIPEDFEFTATGDPCYQSSDGFTKIQEGSEVRLRIVGTKMDQSDIFCIGTIKDDYLGVLGGPV
ncbi:hypothetical protein DUNSADRAFT_15242 [Dunaliella salina]|uniref:RNA polymerase Rpb7-like N-terminal domain-containing protein n=1 Tax=Dunaliella salina TaxID=3046 RepID=A0ABQ7H209_DUNSA|nr:hypothetical protein DUNSADRAFT_15242 [Dunaliella salina]|eukprot:KAF5840875.1 hypothetical protein DUNSADRAFT_15242 [Dunaliella salina]